MKRIIQILSGVVLGITLAVGSLSWAARTLDVGGSGDIVQLLNNWNAVRENLLNDTNTFPNQGEITKGKVFVVNSTAGFATDQTFQIFDDFLAQTQTEADTPWIENSGTDAQAVDPAISVQELGVILLTTGDADSTVGADGSQIVAHIPVQGDSNNLVFEARVHINTSVSEALVNVGLTDITDMTEIPVVAAHAGATTVTTNASNALIFVYDTDLATDQWYAAGVNGDTDSTDNGLTGQAPVADTYQVLRIELDKGSATENPVATFWVDGVKVKTLDAAVSTTTNLYATVLATSQTATSYTVDVDYLSVSHDR